MPRQDGRIEQGQSLKSAISARAWNRAQDAADIVLAERYGFGADGITTARLPGVRAKLGVLGYFGQAVLFGGNTPAFQTIDVAVTPHATNQVNTLSNWSNDEKQIIPFIIPPIGFSHTNSAIAICCGNNSLDYVISGFAFVRVRVFNYNHRYARWPQAFPGQTEQESSLADGALDSAFYGTVRIIGYWTTRGLEHQIAQQQPLVYPAFEMRWALVCI